MKSLTIHNIEEPLLALLREKAQKEDKSINQSVKEMMELSVGMKLPGRDKHKSEFEDLCGVWSTGDLHDFEKATKDFEKIDQDDWK